MSTKKAEKKPAEVAKSERGVKLSDVMTAKRSGVFLVNKDGETLDRCPAERLLADSSAAMMIHRIDPKTNAVSSSVTYGVRWRKTDGGYYVFTIRTSKTLCDEVVKDDRVVGGKLTLIGRGDSVNAALALNQVWTAWAESFGLTHAYRAVRVSLSPNTRDWYALMVPVTEVLG